jgi:hypothetical protein
MAFALIFGYRLDLLVENEVVVELTSPGDLRENFLRDLSVDQLVRCSRVISF